ncbi:GDP-L-fucose synthase family protein [Desulfococcus multivorans]|uniref:GDP-L-fucose synthase n=1 Tax=Desulfococcus multivorans DSM 2059 TaxID=1121405 RepID=S7TAF2_DESML|nr:GDP-L-fucose synthase [Desulfococcus multivorans]AOY60116.1 NAD-dependent epimerase/dehydratase [Desulfococcus multivorans]AQV02251.1 GDP-fucose synthetase [Desulfococcus multivorans]EPR34097.1 NAD-dependent epimerase/dehydratase [Desulfococcus multivorans DSM 2059]SKA27488.1 GDP-L-fucose synthase [Desulfococcus multivorans DSM 2059]
MDKDNRIFIAGHRGLVGSALCRQLAAAGHTALITRTHADLDLTDPNAVADFFSREQPEYVFLAAAKVGGIHANNTYPADFIYQNLQIQNTVIHQAFLHGVKRLLFLGSSCIYPKLCPQPMKESYLMTGPLEPTNSAYATAKIAGIEMCRAYNRQHGTRFIPVMPTNLYGPNDNFDLETSHVLPALIRKFHLAKLAANNDRDGIAADERRFGPIPREIRASLEDIAGPRGGMVMLWGSGTPKREFLHVDDMAAACIHLMRLPWKILQTAADDPFLFNIGTGTDLTIRELANVISHAVGYQGEILFDADKPDGTPRKLLDVSRLQNLGWRAKISLEEGIRQTYRWYAEQK